MGRSMEKLKQGWPGDLIPDYVEKWYGKPYHHPWGWLAVMLGVIMGTGMLSIIGFIGWVKVEPTVLDSRFLLVLATGVILVMMAVGFGLSEVEHHRQERQREHTNAHEFVNGWMKQLGLQSQYEQRRCLHILVALAHLVHHSPDTEQAATNKWQLCLAEQLMYFLYGEVFERDFGDKLDVRELRQLVSVAELQRPDSLITPHYRSYRGYRDRRVCIEAIQDATA